MSNPNYVHTITLYRRITDGSYTRSILHGCFWKAGTAVTQNGVQASQSNVYTVRIPAEQVEAGFSVSMGDIVVHGECADSISNTAGNRAAEVLNRNKPEAFKVTVFSDNTSHLMDKHYRIGG